MEIIKRNIICRTCGYEHGQKHCPRCQPVTLEQHAEAWWHEQGKVLPPHDTPAWQAMYEQWVIFAFDAPSVDG